MPRASTVEKEEERKRKISKALKGIPKLSLRIDPELKKARRDAWQKQFYQDHKERYAAQAKEWRKCNPERMRLIVKRQNIVYRGQQQIWARKRRKKQRYECLFHYSQGEMKCGRCGISDIDVLCLDHINNNGSQERKRWGNGNAFYTNIYRLNFPEGFQVLCWNCNHKKELEKSRNGKDISR